MVNNKGHRRETYHSKEEKEKEEILGRGVEAFGEWERKGPQKKEEKGRTDK